MQSNLPLPALVIAACVCWLSAAAEGAARSCLPGQMALVGADGGLFCVDLPAMPELPDLPEMPDLLDMPTLPPLAPELCLPPYQILLEDGSCSWFCAPGTRPDPASAECVCLDGLAEIGLDAEGRRGCAADPDMPIPTRAETRLLLPPPKLVPQSRP